MVIVNAKHTIYWPGKAKKWLCSKKEETNSKNSAQEKGKKMRETHGKIVRKNKQRTTQLVHPTDVSTESVMNKTRWLWSHWLWVQVKREQARITCSWGLRLFRIKGLYVMYMNEWKKIEKESGYTVYVLLPKKDERFRRRGIKVEAKCLGMGEYVIFRTLELKFLGRSHYKLFHQNHMLSYICWKRFIPFK